MRLGLADTLPAGEDCVRGLRRECKAAATHLFSLIGRQPPERAARALGERNPLFDIVALERLEQVL